MVQPFELAENYERLMEENFKIKNFSREFAEVLKDRKVICKELKTLPNVLELSRDLY